MSFKSLLSWSVASLVLLNGGLSACGDSSKKKKNPATGLVDPTQPVPPQTPQKLDDLVGTWQSQINDPRYAGNFTYTLDKKGRLQASLLVYSRSQRKILAERMEWEGTYDGAYEGKLVKSSCAQTPSKVLQHMLLDRSGYLVVTDPSFVPGTFFLNPVKEGLTDDVHTAKEIHGLPVVDGCFVDGRLTQFEPKQAQEAPQAESIQPSEGAAPAADPKSIKDYCLDTVGQAPDALPYGFAVRTLLEAINVNPEHYNANDCEWLRSKLEQFPDDLSVKGNRSDNTHTFDARVVSGLSKLKNLSVEDLRVAESQALGALKAVKEIAFRRAEFDDMSFFKELTGVKTVIYEDAAIQTLADLSNPSVEKISFWKSQRSGGIESIGENAAFPALKELWLSDQPIKDLKGIGRLTKLEQLWLLRTPLPDLSPLGELIQTAVFLPETTNLTACPVFLGRCNNTKVTVWGGVFGAEKPGSSTFILGRALPGIGKVLKE